MKGACHVSFKTPLPQGVHEDRRGLFDVVLFTASQQEYASEIVASFIDFQVARLCLSRKQCDFAEAAT
jgi:hypothetical protein